MTQPANRRIITEASQAVALAGLGSSVTSTNVLTIGVKGDVVTVTDAAIASGSTALSRSGATKFTSADVGKYVQVVGAGVPFNSRGAWAPSTAYTFGDQVTNLGVTYVCSSTFTSGTTFSTSGLSKMPAGSNSYTLMATILSVASGVATLSASAGTTISGATCVYGTDDSPTITALPSGDYFFPGGRTYFLADWFMVSDTKVTLGAGAVFKIPYYHTTDVRVFGLASAVSPSVYVENVHIYGTVKIDCSELTPSVLGTHPRGVHVLNCRNWSIERIVCYGLPGDTGNALQVGTNDSGLVADRGKVGPIHNRNVRGGGSSCVQHTSGTNIEYGSQTCDGGVAFRCEMDANPDATPVFTDNVRVGVVYANGDSGFPSTGAYFSAHGHTIRNTEIDNVLTEGGPDGVMFENAAGGLIEDVTIRRGRVVGGGAGITCSQNDRSFFGATIYDFRVTGTQLTSPLHGMGGKMPGVGFFLAPGMTYVNCRAISCLANGFKDIYQTGGVVANSRATLFGCEATSNTGAGVYIRSIEKVRLFGGRLGDNPALVTPITAQMLPSSAYTGTMAGYTAITPNTSSVSGAGGVLTVTASGTGSDTSAKTVSGTAGVAVVAGHFYKAVGVANVGTAPAGSYANFGFWWFNSAGTFLSATYGQAVPVSGTNIATSAVAPAGAAFCAIILGGFAAPGGTILSGWTYTFSNIALQEVSGIATQTYGLQADTGAAIDYVGTSFIANGIGNITGSGTITDLGAGVGAGVPSTRQVLAGTGLSGGGDLSVDRTLAVAYGTAAGTAAAGNDTRVLNAARWKCADVATMTRREGANVGLAGFSSGLVVAGLAVCQAAATYTKARLFITGAGTGVSGVKIGIWAADGSSLMGTTADFSGSLVANSWVTVNLAASLVMALGDQVLLGVSETHATTSIGLAALGARTPGFWPQTIADGAVCYRGANGGTWAGGSNALPATLSLTGGPGSIPLIELIP